MALHILVAAVCGLQASRKPLLRELVDLALQRSYAFPLVSRAYSLIYYLKGSLSRCVIDPMRKLGRTWKDKVAR